MHNFEPIAVIGMSGRFPMAEDAYDLDRILSGRVDAVRPMSEERRALFGIPDELAVKSRAYLDGIEYFDHEFFNISKHEAVLMDPQNRIAAELACGAVEDSGYSLSEIRGSRTGVYLGAHSSRYADWLDDNSGLSVMGNLKDTMAGRISYLLDLRADAAVFETACSSSLYAVYHGCMQLNAGECDMALAGGVTLDLQLYEDTGEDDGLSSPDGHCRAFDQRADGINGGEGGGIVFLKRLADAEKDNDPILAVIKSAAANQDGGRSNSVAAPSGDAQKELLLRTWKKGGINPEEIGYYEAHGTGTKLGDPIEISAITDACREYTDAVSICPVGSLKTNYAHMGAAAGIASLIKLIVSMKNDRRYPLRNFQSPNPFIDFEHSMVYPAVEEDSWPRGRKKLGAVSAFGISGTNVHLIMEEYERDADEDRMPETYLFTVSAKTEDGLLRYCSRIAESAASWEASLGSVSYTLNRGRDDYDYRRAFNASDRDELIRKLSDVGKVQKAAARRAVLLCSKISDEAELEFAVDFARCLQEKGVSLWKVIGAGKGNAAMACITAGVTFGEAIESMKSRDDSFDCEGFKSYVAKIQEQEDIIYIETGGEEVLLPHVDSRNKMFVPAAAGDPERAVDRILPFIYECGADIDWSRYYGSGEHRRCHLPTYPFSKTKVWPGKMKSVNGAETGEEAAEDEELSVKEFLRKLWMRELDIDSLRDDEDVFDLGVNSLMGMNILSSIEKRFGIELDFDVIFDCCTVELLEEHICGILNSSEGKAHMEDIADVYRIHPAARREWMPVSYNQRRMLFLLESIPDGSVYNMPNLFRIEGPVDPEAFRASVDRIAANHEILRTVYKKEDGEYYQKVREDHRIPFLHEDRPDAGESELMREFAKDCRYSFRLDEEPPVRHRLINAGDSAFWFVNVHHIAADGWSVGIFMKEFIEYYEGYMQEKELRPEIPEIQYADYSAWENGFLEGEEAAKQMRFWNDELDGFSGILKFPTDKKRPSAQTFSGSVKHYSVPENLVEELRRWSRKHAVSLFMVLESAYALNLCLYTGQTDIGVGVPVANRTQAEAQGLIGFFSNTVVIRSRIDRQQTLEAFIEANAERIADVYQNTQLPFEEVVSRTQFERLPGFSPLFQYSFVMQNYGRQGKTLEDIGFAQVESLLPSTSHFEMTYNLVEKENELEIMAEYNTDLFFESTIDDFTEQYVNILSQIVHSPEETAGSLQRTEPADDSADSADSFRFY